MKTLHESTLVNFCELYENWENQFYNEYGSVNVRVTNHGKSVHVEAWHDLANTSHVDYWTSYTDFLTDVVMYNLCY